MTSRGLLSTIPVDDLKITLHSQSLMTEWDQEREKEEFQRSAIFFKPMAQVISNR